MPRWRRLNMAAAIATVVTVAYYLEHSRHAIFLQADAVQKKEPHDHHYHYHQHPHHRKHHVMIM